MRTKLRLSLLFATAAILLAVPVARADAPDEAAIPSSAAAEVVGLSLQGTRARQRVVLNDLDAILTPDGGRLVPMLRFLDALQVEYGRDGDTVTIKGLGEAPVVIDAVAGTLTAGSVERPLEVLRATGEISGDQDLFVRPEVVAELLSIQLEWNEMEYTFNGRTSRKWPIWKTHEGVSLRNTQVAQAEIDLPEMFGTAEPNRSSLGFMELQTRFSSSRQSNPWGDMGFSSARSSLWGTLLGGEYRAQVTQPEGTDPQLESANWRYELENSEIAAGDSIFGLSDLVFPSMRVFGVRANGIRGLNGATDGTSRGLQQRFTQTRVFDGTAPVGSKVSLVIDDRVIDEKEVYADASSPSGNGHYRFEDVLLRTGLLNDISVIIEEPDGTITENRRGVVESPLIAPRGAFGFLAGVGTDRERQEFETNGMFGGFRAIYGLTDNLTISGAVGVQDGFYGGYPRDFFSTTRQLPDSSTSVGTQFAWKPLDKLLVSADVGVSRGEGRRTTDAYDDTAVRVTTDYFPTGRATVRSQLFRYGPDYFNGQNLDLRDRRGYAVGGQYRLFDDTVLDYATADVQGGDDGDPDSTSKAGFHHLAVSTSRLPRTSLIAEIDRLDADYLDDARTAINLRTQTSLPANMLLRSRLFFGDGFSDSRTSQLFSGLNLPGVSISQQGSQSLTLSKQLRRRGTFGVSYLQNQGYSRPTVFGSTIFSILGRPLSVGSVFGYEISDDGGSSDPYFENQTSLNLSTHGKSRIGFRTRLQRGAWSSSFNMSFLTSFDQGLRARLLNSRIKPDQGGIHGTVFLDYNANGLRDSGEPGVEDVKIFMGGRTRTATDRHGYFIMPGIRKQKEARVHLDMESVPATYSASHGQQAALLRSGHMTRVNLAVTPLIAVSGYVFAKDGSGIQKPLSGARVVLRKDGVAKELKDSFTGRDGSFYIGGVRPGDYLLEVDPISVPDDHVLATGPRKVKVLPEKDSQEVGVPAFVAELRNPDLPVFADAATPETIEPAVETAEQAGEPAVDTASQADELPVEIALPIDEPAVQADEIPLETALPIDEPAVDTAWQADEIPLETALPIDEPAVDTAVRTEEPVELVVRADEPGTLDVNWQPWATVKVEGYPELTTPCSFEGLSPGTYEIVLRHPDLGQLTREVVIPSGEQVRLVGSFQNMGILNVNAAPWAEVIINGKAHGTTPLQVRIPEGEHTVALINRNTDEVASFSVSMPSGGVKKVSYQF